MNHSDPRIQSLQDEIFWSKVKQAREMPPHKKFVLGFTLFEESLVWMRAGIRRQFPHYCDEQVEAELQRRLQIARRLDEEELARRAGVSHD